MKKLLQTSCILASLLGGVAQAQAPGRIYGSLLNQASLWAFIENFRLFGLACLLCLPLVLLFKKARRGATPGPGLGH